RHLQCRAGRRSLAAGAGLTAAQSARGRRLDAYGLARDDGRGGTQRLSRRRRAARASRTAGRSSHPRPRLKRKPRDGSPWALLHSPAAHAQRWGSPEIDRVYGPGAKVPYDGAPWTYRYNYTYSALYVGGGGGRSLNYADYLDRFDRALKFGYPIPRDPLLAN